jgi:hypothetical protein
MEESKTKITPYRTSAGVMIGQFYEEREPMEYCPDMERIQVALIYDPQFLRKFWLKNVTYVSTVVITILALAIFTR